MSQEPKRWELSPATRPPKRGPWLDFLDVEPGKEYRVTIVSEQLRGYHCHWIKPKTRACVGGPELCPHCLAQQPRKVYWFLHVENRDGGGHFLLMLTDYSAEPLDEYGRRRGSLRGAYVRLRRRNAHKKSPITVTVIDACDPDRVRTAERPVEESLRRLWSFPTEVDPAASAG